MSDDEGGSAMEQLLSRHRKEKKDLKEKILSMKKAAKCGNKQKQKDMNAEADELEKKLKERHDAEVAALNESEPSPPPVESASTETMPEPTEQSFYKEVKLTTKKQKKQEKAKEANRRLQEAIAEDRANALTSLRFTEMTALTKALDNLNLSLVDIAPDGDCLYKSIAHQLSRTPGFSNITGKDVRRRAAKHILQNREDFLPFLTNDDGDPLDDIQLEDYCRKVENEAKDGGVWGGEPELNALSHSLERRIEVIQPEGRIVVFGEEYTTKPLTIVYQRHAFQLGEHYNSTEPKSFAAQ